MTRGSVKISVPPCSDNTARSRYSNSSKLPHYLIYRPEDTFRKHVVRSVAALGCFVARAGRLGTGS